MKGFKNTEVGLIPSDWDVKNIVENSTMKARIGWQGLTVAEYLDKGDYFLITGTDFVDGRIKWETCHYVDKERYVQDKNIQIRVGDILITKDGTIGKIAFIDKLPLRATLNSGVFVIRPKDEAYLPAFLFYVFNSFYFHDFLNKLVAGSTINHLYQKDFVSFNFPLPTLAEQTAIATALNDADALIQKLEQLIAKKRNIKTGAMQKCLNPDFYDLDDDHDLNTTDAKSKKSINQKNHSTDKWEVKKLGIVADISKGQLITAKTAVPNGVPVIGGGMTVSYYHNKPNRKGITITISASDAYAGYISIHRYPIFASDCSTISEAEEYDIYYLYFCLLNKQREIYALQTGGGQPHVYPKQLRDIFIPIPKNKNKQTDIAQILSDMDNEIQELEKQLEKYKRIKQGMMQNLLTGKIRLV